MICHGLWRAIFNEPLSGEDKFRGRAVSVSRSLLFKECLDKCNMINIRFSGPQFTWTNRRDIQALIQERIDRVFINPSWCLLYPEAQVVHLTRCHSDHCPILLEMQLITNIGRKRPFRFQTCWLSKPSFPPIVSRAWSDSPALGEAVNRFTQAAIDGMLLILAISFLKRRTLWLGSMGFNGL